MCGIPLRFTVVLGFAAVLFAASAIAQDAPDSREVPPKDILDQLPGAVDPFNEGKQREQFLRASGVDTELSRDEFVAAKKGLVPQDASHKPQSDSPSFLRPFDAWPGLAHFDKNKNKSVDWVEFHEYRKAVLVVLLKHHDTDKDGKLLAAERDEANRALASNKLLKYLDAECCGGAVRRSARDRTLQNDQLKQRLSIEAFPTRGQAQRLFDELKQRAMLDNPMIEGVLENELLPITKAPNAEDLNAMLRPSYAAHLAEIMPESDWRTLLENLENRLRWRFEADHISLTRLMEFNQRYTGLGGDTGNELVARAIRDSADAAFLSDGSDYKIGFSGQPVSLSHGSPFAHMDQGWAVGLSNDLQDEFKDLHHIISIEIVCRRPPTLILTSSPLIADQPDEYYRIVNRYIYNPNSPNRLCPLDTDREEITREEAGAIVMKK